MCKTRLQFDKEIQDLTSQIIELKRQLDIATGIDQMTGLVSKGRMYEILEREFAIFDRDARNLGNRRPNHFSIIFVDLDGFKALNDGNHLRGDRLLIEFGQYLKRVTRKRIDVVARFGGDEFVILLPKADLPHTQALCKKIKRGLVNSFFDLEHEAVKLSCSLAAASTSEGIMDYRSLLNAADSRMHNLKELKKLH